MSLLGTPVYANTSTPLWLSTNGDVMTGDLVFEAPNSVSWQDASGNDLGRIVGTVVLPYPPPPNPPNSTLYIQNNDTIAFGQIGSTGYNTSINIDVFGGEDALVVNGLVQATNLALKDDQAVGVGTIPIGQSSVNITFTTPLIGVPYVFTQFAGTPSAGPTRGTSQGVLSIGNLTTTGFTVDLTDIDGITKVAADTDAVFLWFAVIHD